MSIFFFKQKTAYEMRISDWSSDVCSSDLCLCFQGLVDDAAQPALQRFLALDGGDIGGGLFGKHAEDCGTDGGVVLFDRLGHLGIIGGGDAKPHLNIAVGVHRIGSELGRESGRERVCQYVWSSGVAV